MTLKLEISRTTKWAIRCVVFDMKEKICILTTNVFNYFGKIKTKIIIILKQNKNKNNYLCKNKRL